MVALRSKLVEGPCSRKTKRHRSSMGCPKLSPMPAWLIACCHWVGSPRRSCGTLIKSVKPRRIMTSQTSAESSKSTVSVLIAEDNRLQAKVLQDRLTKAGYDVRVGVNGAITLDMARQQRPDIIISDIEMPEMTGHELCRAIKSDDQLRSVPVILLSTLSEPEDVIRGLDCGADNYVTKPYRTAYLISRMESLLQTPLGVDEDVLELEVTLAGTP